MPRPRDFDDEEPTTRLVLSGLVLLLPLLALVSVSDPPVATPLLWLTGLVPVMVAAATGRWRLTAATGTTVLALVLATHLALSAIGRPIPDLLPHVAVILLLVGLGATVLSLRIDEARGKADELALTDSLTGLPNHRHALVFLETMFGAAERGRPIAVILFDLDHFRHYNEAHGRTAGSTALRRFADLLSASTRRMNLSARLGGEEFISIMAGVGEEGARSFAERTRESLQAMYLQGEGLTVSAGVASYHPSMRNPDELVAAADLALYRAKEEGRNRVRVFGRDVGPAEGRPARSEGLPEQEPGASTVPYRTDPSRIGKSPPPDDLLPDSRPQYGTGRTILLVEHGTGLEDTVGGYLRSEGFEVATAPDAPSAIQALGRDFDAVVTDLNLPGLSGTELVRAVKSRWPATQVLIVAGSRSTQMAADAVNAGGDRFLDQPLTLPEFQTHLVDSLARRDRMRAEQQSRHQLSQASFEREDESRKMVVRGILALARAAEMHDSHSQGHARRVAGYASAILDGLGASNRDLDPELFRLGCLVHNVGMLEVPAEVLNKNGPLSPEEFERIRRHPETGRRILEPLLGDELILSIVRWHHERWDGTGYPDGLAGEAIPIAARITAIGDAIAAMTSPRTYRRALAWEDAIRQIRDRAGTHFDPGLIEAFNAALPQLHRSFLQSERDRRDESAVVPTPT